jgi:hypothetical protein
MKSTIIGTLSPIRKAIRKVSTFPPTGIFSQIGEVQPKLDFSKKSILITFHKTTHFSKI